MDELNEIVNFLSYDQRNAICDNLKSLSTFIKGLTYESGMSDSVALAAAICCLYEYTDSFNIQEFKRCLESYDC